MRRTPPLFPPYVWNVHQATINQTERTNNACEGWNNAFSKMVGHSHPALYSLIRCIQMDQAVVATDILLNARGQPPTKKPRRAFEEHQRHLLNICCDRRDGRKTVGETLIALGHCVRLAKF